MRFPYAILLALGCAATRPTAPAADAPSSCMLERAKGARDTIVIGSGERTGASSVIRPATATERLIFAAVYETLIDIDCQGIALPALASSWRSDFSGRRWTFTLRDSARFSDGSQVTPALVLESWMEQRGDTLSGQAVLAAAGAVATAEGDAIIVSFEEPREALPHFLAHPALAVRRPPSPTAGPLGTGRYRSGMLRLRSNEPARLTILPVGSATRPVIVLRGAGTTDPRDLLDSGADLVLTGAPEAIAYAATRSDVVSHPLPWDRTYVFLSSIPRPRPPATDLAALGDLLARDAVRAEARGVKNPAWWHDALACRIAVPAGATGAATRTRRPRIIYPQDDAVARDLATRLLAVSAFESQDEKERALFGAAMPELRTSDTPLAAVGLSSAQFSRSLFDGSDYAYVVPLPNATVAPCSTLQELLTAAPWLANHADRDSAAGNVATNFHLEEVLIPLVETRSRLLMRRGAADVELAGNGTVRLAPPAGTPQTRQP